jgi:hypothetical protein
VEDAMRALSAHYPRYGYGASMFMQRQGHRLTKGDRRQQRGQRPPSIECQRYPLAKMGGTLAGTGFHWARSYGARTRGCPPQKLDYVVAASRAYS